MITESLATRLYNKLDRLNPREVLRPFGRGEVKVVQVDYDRHTTTFNRLPVL